MELEDAIQIKNLIFYHNTQLIIDHANFSFKKNKFSVLLGANGCGKSTLFNILSRLQKKYAGNINYFGKDLRELKGKLRAETIGILPQHFSTTFPLTVEDILLTGRAAFSKLNYSKDDILKIQNVLVQLGIEHLKNKQFNTLSGGQQQMVLIGRILVQSPKIILLDEPTNHLDIYYQHYLMKLLKTLSKQHYTIVAILHNPTLAFQYADEIYYMYEKKIFKNESSAPNLEILSQMFNLEFDCARVDDNKHIIVK